MLIALDVHRTAAMSNLRPIVDEIILRGLVSQ